MAGYRKPLTCMTPGIRVLSVALHKVLPPEEVRSAFDGVLRARQEKLTLINQARSYEKYGAGARLCRGRANYWVRRDNQGCALGPRPRKT